MNNVATLYYHLGRLEDALVLREQTLKFYQRVLPENHPDIGMR
jgi:outer membrane protein TolC